MGWYRIEALMAGFRIVMIDERPKKVLVERRGDLEIHYFYWDLDLYKPFDYEPVTVLGSSVLSRYHWRFLVLWNAPVKREGKPLVSFFLGVHTPLVVSEKRVPSLIFCSEDISLEEKFYLGLFMTMLYSMHQGLKVDEGRFHGYKDLIEEDSVPEKFRFDPEAWDFLVAVGKPLNARDLPELIKKGLEKCK